MLNNASLGKKIGAGFALTSLILAASVLVTMWQVRKSTELSERSIELRGRTLQNTLELRSGVQHSLAALRGWIILGNDEFKDSRAEAWANEIDPALAAMTELSANWTDPENRSRLDRIKTTAVEFRKHQAEIEAIAQTPGNVPANKLLRESAMSVAAVLAREITAMIDAEAKQSATSRRKALLGMMADVRGTTGLALANVRAFLLTGDGKYKQQYDTLWRKNTLRYSDLRQNSALLTDAQRLSFASFSDARERFEPLVEKMFDLRGTEDWNLANHWLSTKAAPAAGTILSELDKMIESQRALLASDQAASAASNDQLKDLLWTLLALGVLASVTCGVYITRLVTRPLAELVESAKALARGSTSHTINYESSDELGQLAAAFRTMTASQQDMANAARTLSRGDLGVDIQVRSDEDVLGRSMREMVDSQRMIASTSESLGGGDLTVSTKLRSERDDLGMAINQASKSLHEAMSQVSMSAQQLQAASNQIAETSQSVAQGASEQASSLQETSSSLEELSSMTRQNSESTKQARALAETMRKGAAEGDGAMAEMIAAMTKIRQAAESTAEIISDINQIAFQTNLLALNAAVEAARAGDAGRGFAVVAEEVRNLALRSKDAAQKTEQLIKQSVDLTQQGGSISVEVRAKLTEIVGSVTEVSDLVGKISTASEEQADGIEQVNRAVAEMDKVVQQSAANSEESSSAAEQLASQARALTGLVSRFKLNGAGRRALVQEPGAEQQAMVGAFESEQVRPRNVGRSMGATVVPLHGARDGTVSELARSMIPFDEDLVAGFGDF